MVSRNRFPLGIGPVAHAPSLQEGSQSVGIVEDGHVGLPDTPGIGLECQASLAPVLAAVRG